LGAFGEGDGLPHPVFVCVRHGIVGVSLRRGLGRRLGG
jgi:hypothetical protein